VLIVFLNEVGDLAPLEGFLKEEKLIEVEAARKGEKALSGDAVLIEELNGSGHK